LADGLRRAIAASTIPAQVQQVGSLLTLFFCAESVHDFDRAKHSDTIRFAKFFSAMLHRGILLPPSQFEALFISAAHTEQDVAYTVEACHEALQEMSQLD
jgi:glutamate-1-semialdehyde 2,1-aminomutase